MFWESAAWTVVDHYMLRFDCMAGCATESLTIISIRDRIDCNCIVIVELVKELQDQVHDLGVIVGQIHRVCLRLLAIISSKSILSIWLH